MDRIAQVVGLSAVEIAAGISSKPGRTTTTDQTVREPIDMNKLLDRALELSDYVVKRRLLPKDNGAGEKEGMGIAAFCVAPVSPVQGERYLSSVVGVEGCTDGGVRVLVSSTEFGQGTKTVLCQITWQKHSRHTKDVDIAGGYERSSEQRSNGRVSHGYGGGKAGAVGGAGNQANTGRWWLAGRVVPSGRISRRMPEADCRTRAISLVGALRGAE
jgi:CO/xanthine dehydrogenase Mo-binding subunit